MEFAVVALLIVYLVPWMFAVAREHEHQSWILAANLLLGWTGIGWLAALAWSVASDPQPSKHRRRPALQVLEGSASSVRTSHGTPPKMILVRNDR